MKNYLKVSLLSLAALLCACSEDEKISPSPQGTDTGFTAGTESYTYTGTKTHMSNKSVLWDTDDPVAVWAGSKSGEYKVYAGGKTTASLQLVSGSAVTTSAGNVGFYPYSQSLLLSESGSIYKVGNVEIPATQHYVAGTFAKGEFPMIAVTADTSSKSLAFKNVLGLIRLTLKDTTDNKSSVKSIKFSGNSNETLSDVITILASSTTAPVVQHTLKNASTSITLDCGDGVALTDAGVDFYIALAPVTFSKGFKVVVTSTSGTESEFSTSSEVTVVRSAILPMETKNVSELSVDALIFLSEGESTLALTKTGSPTASPKLEYSVDKGKTWTSWDYSAITYTGALYLRGTGNTTFADAFDAAYCFTMGGDKAKCTGNIMRLLDYANPGTEIKSALCFYKLFGGCSLLTAAPELPATTLADSCYYGMFFTCTGLISAPALPATTLTNGCYQDMFSGCTSLTVAPELPATIAKPSCYRSMFYNCTALTQAPELPATTVAEECYHGMFHQCLALTSAPALPATTLALDCYYGMFYNCTALTQAPELPATTLAEGCYAYMFQSCKGLTTAPELPATTAIKACYKGMFYQCTSLIATPELPATTLESNCYFQMFSGCTSLTTTLELSAKELAPYCYGSMFYGCTSLKVAPKILATTVGQYSCSCMFKGCTSLTTVPELSASVLDAYGYFQMFNGCSKLSYIKCLAVNFSASKCLEDWTSGVAATGTFVKDMCTTWSTGTSGIPKGWTVENGNIGAGDGNEGLTENPTQSW